MQKRNNQDLKIQTKHRTEINLSTPRQQGELRRRINRKRVTPGVQSPFQAAAGFKNSLLKVMAGQASAEGRKEQPGSGQTQKVQRGSHLKSRERDVPPWLGGRKACSSASRTDMESYVSLCNSDMENNPSREWHVIMGRVGRRREDGSLEQRLGGAWDRSGNGDPE